MLSAILSKYWKQLIVVALALVIVAMYIFIIFLKKDIEILNKDLKDVTEKLQLSEDNNKFLNDTIVSNDELCVKNISELNKIIEAERKKLTENRKKEQEKIDILIKSKNVETKTGVIDEDSSEKFRNRINSTIDAWNAGVR